MSVGVERSTLGPSECSLLALACRVVDLSLYFFAQSGGADVRVKRFLYRFAGLGALVVSY